MNGEQFALSQFLKSVARMRALQQARRAGHPPIELSELRAAEKEVDENIVEAQEYMRYISHSVVQSLTPDTATLPPIPRPEPIEDIELPPVPPLPIDGFDIPAVPPLEVPPLPAIAEDDAPAKKSRKRGGQHGS